MPTQHSLQHILSDAKNQPTSSTTVLLSTYVTQDITAISHFLYTLLQPLLDGSHNILSSVKHWGLIAKNLAQRIQPINELIPIMPGLLLNEFLINSTFLSAYFFTVLITQLITFCVFAALLMPTDQQRIQLPNKFMPMIFSLCLRNLNLAISKSVQLSNTAFCDIYTALSGAETCDSSNTIMTRFLGVPMTFLSGILLLQLANRISMSVTAWHKKQFIAAQPSSVTLSSTKLFEITATLSIAFMLSMQKSILLQVQGGVVLYQYLSPSRDGLGQYTSVFTFLLTLIPSLITESQTILTNNERRHAYNMTHFEVIENHKTVVTKLLQDVRHGDVIQLTSDSSGKLKLPKAFGVLTSAEPIAVIYNKSGINGESDKYTAHIGKENHTNIPLKILSNDDAGQLFENGLIIAPGIEIEKNTSNLIFYFRVYPSVNTNSQPHRLEYTYQDDLSQLNTKTIQHLLFFTLGATALQLIITENIIQSRFLLQLTGKLFRNFFDYTQISLPLGVTALLSSQILLYFKKMPHYSHLTVTQKDKLITLAAHTQKLIDADREVVIVSDKTGTITTSKIECHDIIPVNATQDIANNVVLATYQGLSKETEAEEHALLEKIKETNIVFIESLCDTQRVFKKTLNKHFITTWQLGFIREITASVTLVKQNDSYLLIFATGKLPHNINAEYSAIFKNHCEKKSRMDIERQHARFRRDWAYTLFILLENDTTIQLIKNICEHHKAGTKIPTLALESIIPALKKKLRHSLLIAITDNTNALKTNASEFLNHPNRHLLTGDNARACVSFAKILFSNKTIIIFDSPTQHYKNADFSNIDSISIETLSSAHLLIISKFSENDRAILSRILEKNLSDRPYLMFSDCTPESKAFITQQLYKRKNKPFIVGFGDGANDAKMLECVDLSVSCLINDAKINQHAHFTDEEIMRCFNETDLLQLFHHFKINPTDAMAKDLSPALCMIEKANPLFYAKSSKLAYALFFRLFAATQAHLFQLELAFDFGIYAFFSTVLSNRALSLYDVKPIVTRERDYTQLIAAHAISANVLACFIYGAATLCNLDSRAATLYSLSVVPLYWKYHTQLLKRYPNQSHTFFDGQRQTDNTMKHSAHNRLLE